MQNRIQERFAGSRGVPLVMGVLNVTDDSFSDGGCFLDRNAAVARALTMISEEADIIDVGPESTRPGAMEIAPSLQIERAIPVIDEIRRANASIPIAIDTRSASVAREALAAGADMINDVSAMRDDAGMADLAAQTGAWICLMHRRGTAATMQLDGGPEYGDVVAEILEFLRERVASAELHGVDRSRIVVDPGLGFGKRVEHNLEILRALERFTTLGLPVLVGASRKSFLGAVAGGSDPIDRDPSSLACAVMAAFAGVSIIRTHDVRATLQVVRMSTAVRQAGR